jgi:AraC family transcriptional regulator of arabinose operon
MPSQENLPSGLFEAPSTLRILRIDDQFRYVTLMAKAHGLRPDSRANMVMEGFAINYVLRGQGIYREDSGRTHALTPGTFFQRLPGRRHSTILDAASDYAELFLVIDQATALQLMALGLIVDVEVLSVGGSAGVAEAFCGLRQELSRPESDLPTHAALARVVDFIHMLYDLAHHAETGDAWSSLIRQACAQLERDLDQRLEMAEVARSLGVAYPTFRRRFREAMGVSPGAYRVRRRLEQARYLLLDKSVKEVAAELGYSDPFTFSAQFKGHFGLSPQRFQGW